MQFIVHKMNILPRSYWAEARNLFQYIQYNFIQKENINEFQYQCALQNTGRFNINDINRLRITYLNAL